MKGVLVKVLLLYIICTPTCLTTNTLSMRKINYQHNTLQVGIQ